MSVAGGLEVAEPAVDLAVAAAVASSFRNRPVPARTVLIGEVGLAGEVRSVGQVGPAHPRSRADGLRPLHPPRPQPAPRRTTASGWSGSRTLEEALERLADG